MRAAVTRARACAMVGAGTATCMSLAPVALADVVGAGAGRAAHAHGAKHRGTPCQRQHGRTIVRRGTVRVFKSGRVAYGCVQGSTHTWALWQATHNLYEARSGAVTQVSGRFVAVTTSSSSQYGALRELAAFDLRSGKTYSLASINEEEFGHRVSGEPPTPGPWPLEASVLGPDGRSARLYNTYAPSARSDYTAAATGQVVDLVGFHQFHRQLATAAPGAIAPSSLSYDGHTVSWSQNGSPRTVSADP
jgi:hypothetical protein